jgi:hypothetical protein
MMVFMEVIPPPPLVRPVSDDEMTRLVEEHLAEEDSWVEDFIARLAGIFREPKK